MLKRLVNEARLQLTLTAESPVLIKSGHPTLVGPDMTPVLTYRNGRSEVYLPGTSLKGVGRSHIEKVVNTLTAPRVVVCDPFSHGGATQSCSARFDNRQRRANPPVLPPEVYRDSCPACRLFGSTSFIGRLDFGDAYLPEGANPRPTETRDGVGIDRLTGGAATGAQAKFDLEVVSPGTQFTTTIVLRNFEIWQLGALMLLIQDYTDGLLRVGSGRSRALGLVRGTASDVTIYHLGPTKGRAEREIWGLGKFLGANSPYGTRSDDTLALDNAPPTHSRGIRAVQTYGGDALADLQTKAVQAFVQRMEGWADRNERGAR